MARAHELAARALPLSDPNPRVGCVLVRDGEIVGEGWTQEAGGAHAEVFAIQRAGESSKGACAYVTLEPCAHQGRTGPCTEALIAAGVTAVVYAVDDPNPEVAGAGARTLKAAGLEVRCNSFGIASEQHNLGYFRRHNLGMPWVRLKSAISVDGRTALADGSSEWITGVAARADVQLWRARSSAIVTGSGTVLRDNPRLNLRLDEDGGETDQSTRRQPLRVVIDSNLKTPPSARILQPSGAVLLACVDGQDKNYPEHVEVARYRASASGGVDLQELLRDLARRGCNEIQVEAGARLSGALLTQNLVDEWLVYMAPTLMGTDALALADIPSPSVMGDLQRWKLLSVMMIGDDARLLLRRPSGEKIS